MFLKISWTSFWWKLIYYKKLFFIKKFFLKNSFFSNETIISQINYLKIYFFNFIFTKYLFIKFSFIIKRFFNVKKLTYKNQFFNNAVYVNNKNLILKKNANPLTVNNKIKSGTKKYFIKNNKYDSKQKIKKKNTYLIKHNSFKNEFTENQLIYKSAWFKEKILELIFKKKKR